MNPIHNYLATLAQECGRGWNRFWFTPRSSYALCILRVVVGLAALIYHLSHTADLVRWFGPQGLLPAATAGELNSESYRWSYLSLSDHPAWLWTAHGIGLLILALFTAGLWTRVSSLLSLIVVLSYVHRGTILAGEIEPVLTMLMLYLCLAPAGTWLSVDSLRERRAAGEHRSDLTISAAVSTRLIQLHLAGFYGMMGLSQLASEAWWSGEAVWWLMAHTESRLVDLTSLHSTPGLYLVNAWTHGIVLFELAFGLLIWNRLARPLVLFLSIGFWLSILPITGLVGFCLLMLSANIIYMEPAALLKRVSAHAD